MPSVRPGESEKDYVARCIPVVLKEGTAQDNRQAAAVCYSLFKEHHEKRLPLLLSKRTDTGFALDLPSTVQTDEKLMSATATMSTKDVDRVGDVVNPPGIVDDSFRRCPNILWNHQRDLPDDIIGLARDPDGNYTVHIDEKSAVETTYFKQDSAFAEQVYHDICGGYINANSIGYLPLKKTRLRTGGNYLERIDLIEVSWVIGPVNRSCTVLATSTAGGSQERKALIDQYRSAGSRYRVCGRALDRRLAVGYAKALRGLGFRANTTVIAGWRGPGTMPAIDTKQLTGESKGVLDGQRLPHGANFFHTIHDWLYRICDYIDQEADLHDHEDLKAFAHDFAGGLKSGLGSLEQKYAELYPDEDQLPRVGTHAEEEAKAEGVAAETESETVGNRADDTGGDVETKAESAADPTLGGAASADETSAEERKGDGSETDYQSGEESDENHPGNERKVKKTKATKNADCDEPSMKSVLTNLTKTLTTGFGELKSLLVKPAGEPDVKSLMASLSPEELDELLDEIAEEESATVTDHVAVHAGRRARALNV